MHSKPPASGVAGMVCYTSKCLGMAGKWKVTCMACQKLHWPRCTKAAHRQLQVAAGFSSFILSILLRMLWLTNAASTGSRLGWFLKDSRASAMPMRRTSSNLSADRPFLHIHRGNFAQINCSVCCSRTSGDCELSCSPMHPL
jgi:hypothetical protein